MKRRGCGVGSGERVKKRVWDEEERGWGESKTANVALLPILPIQYCTCSYTLERNVTHLSSNSHSIHMHIHCVICGAVVLEMYIYTHSLWGSGELVCIVEAVRDGWQGGRHSLG